MKKKFNVTGVCYPELHYMMDNSAKVNAILSLIEDGAYFTMSRPRQYGKTTTLYFLGEALRKSTGYLPLEINFQGIDEQWHESDGAFARMFTSQLQKAFKFAEPTVFSFLHGLAPAIQDMNALSDAITELVHQVDKKLVLLIDEVDASSQFSPFLNFLGLLRTKYLARFKPQHSTFHSIVLAGVHDIKTFKHKVRPEETAQYNSPWNIAVDFDVDMSFNPLEIAPMLQEYSEAESVAMDIPSVAGHLHYYTSGYPFLVSKLCKIIAEKVLPGRAEKVWALEDVEQAVQLLLMEDNTNFDSLIKNLENNQSLYSLVHRVLVEGDAIPFNQHNPTIHLGVLYGIFKNNGQIKIHNRLYEQLIYNYMASKALTNIDSRHIYGGHFILKGHALDMKTVLLKFQQFMKEQYSDKNKDFYEREGRVIFLAFLAPILNGKGYAFREVQTSLEKRLDVIITYFHHRYIIELKLWYGEEYHQKGLAQLADYLDIHGVSEGFLIIFDDRKEKSWKTEAIEHRGKDIFSVWV